MPYCINCDRACRTTRAVYDEETGKVKGYICSKCDPETYKRITERAKTIYNTPDGRNRKLIANKKLQIKNKGYADEKDIEYLGRLMSQLDSIKQEHIEYLEDLVNKLDNGTR